MATITNREKIHTYLVIKGAGQAERIIVWDSQDVSLGRSPENDISIDDAVLSRRHAEFFREGAGFSIKDLGTSNGTTVNGETVHTRVLQNKDVVRIGEIEISFLQVAKNPAAIGKKVEFASQLKSFGGAAGKAKDGEATMLGLVQTLDGDEGEEEFVVGKMNDFGADLAEMQAPAKRQTPRNLDAELGGLGGDELGGDDLNAPPANPIPPAHRLPAPAKPGPRLAPAPNPDWALDDVSELPPVAKPQARPAARAPAPAPARPAAPRPAAAPAKKAVSLQLEIEGLSGELRRVVEALLGKVIELPPLRIRVKGDDL
jgi:predicted component of type VI protein secretion system